MQIRCGYTIAYDCRVPTPMVLMLSVHPSRMPDLLTSQEIHTEPKLPVHEYTDGFGNVCHRILAPAGRTTLHADFTIVDSGLPDAIVPEARQIQVQDLPDEVMVFLLGSRYCETDRLSDTAWSLFGNTPTGWARVQAILDYVHDRITFGYEYARPDKTAWDAFQERRGVCRDFAHLSVTFCRAMNIPARYCTGYLGDIGVPKSDAPMDFSAWFDVYLDGPQGGQWYTVDARHNKARIGRILQARGRDASDVAITTNFGPAWLAQFDVVTDEIQA